jgi:hypothetical protein
MLAMLECSLASVLVFSPTGFHPPPHPFTILSPALHSIDEVIVGPMYARLLNVIDGLLDPNAALMGFLIRDLLANSTFDEAGTIPEHLQPRKN